MVDLEGFISLDDVEKMAPSGLSVGQKESWIDNYVSARLRGYVKDEARDLASRELQLITRQIQYEEESAYQEVES